ncbi:MAG: cytochrome b [Gammaproteobacteria bacterium]|nr:cytochrome b [Gammaproteobacteria bacterium]MCW9054978.1 cytochrome b [Gammaproteobacteria bacterium]
MAEIRNTENNWGWLAIFFHWLTAATVFSMFIFGLWMTDLTYYHPWYKTAPELHKSIGLLLLLLTLLRLAWRFIDPAPAPLANHSAFEIKVAHRVHTLLYFLLLGMMLSGYLISTADGRAITVFKIFEIPAIIYGIDHQEDVAGVIHLTLGVLLVIIALLHAGAAIKHHLVDKDRTLKRMFGR